MILLGAPGAGKGTQAKLIGDKYKVAHISMGDLLREAVRAETELGSAAKEHMTTGKLVPNEIVMALLKERLNSTGVQNGYILDGFPRNVDQAKLLVEVDEQDLVLNIEVDFAVLLKRLTGRRSCGQCGAVFHIKYNPPAKEGICDRCGSELIHREDDSEAMISKRLETYNNQTKPLIRFYEDKHLLKTIPGKGDIDNIFATIVSVLDDLK